MKFKKIVLMLPLFILAFASFAYCADESVLRSSWTSQWRTGGMKYELTEGIVYDRAMSVVTEEDNYSSNPWGWGEFWSPTGRNNFDFSVKSATYTVYIATTIPGVFPWLPPINVYESSPSSVRWTIDANQKSAAFTFLTGNRPNGSGNIVKHDFEYLTITNGLMVSSNTFIKGGGAYGNYFNRYSTAYGQFYSSYSYNMTDREIYFTDIHFVSNTVRGNNAANGANVYGGAVFIGGYSGLNYGWNMPSIDVVFSSGIQFTGNYSSGYGGAYVSLYDGVNTLFGMIKDEDDSDFTLFESNQTGKDGGAIYFKGGAGSLINFNGSFAFNSNSAGGSGGAVYYEKTNANGTLVFGNENYSGYSPVLFIGNVAASSGGALYAANLSTVTFYDAVNFSSNFGALGGGAIFITTGSLVFSSHSAAVFHDNKTSNSANSDGGAIYKGGSGQILFNFETYLIGNTAGGSGGAIYSSSGAMTFFADAVITDNRANSGSGGAIYSGRGAITFNGETEISRNFSDSHGGAIYSGDNSALIFNSDAVIQNNTSASGRGGAIFKGFGGNISFSSSANISDNFAGGHGGAVYGAGTVNISFHEEAFFTGNKSSLGSGGAIYKSNGVNNTSMTFTQSVTFTSNTAALGGGAIFNVNGFYIFNEDAFFYWNVSNDPASILSAGGAIHAEGGFYDFKGNAVFEHNSTEMSRGGAIFAQSAQFVFANASFYANTIAGDTPEGGAAIYAVDSKFIFKPGVTNFTENKTAGITNVSGGALYALRSTYTFEGTVNFTSNSATAMGGAAAFAASYGEFSGDTFFKNNTAENGGAIALVGTGGDSISFKGNVTFAGNKSYGESLTGGGAVLMFVSSGIQKIDFAAGKTASFTDNTSAGNGGVFAVYSETRSEVDFNGAAQFNSNAAAASGGAFFSFLYGNGSGKYNFTDAGYFTNNRAGISGGAIYAFGNNAFNINSNIKFTSNSASGIDASGGGAVYSVLSTFTFSGAVASEFKNNSASSRGGAIYQEKGFFDFQSGANFILNSAGGSGGAIYASTGIMTFNYSVLFESNTASGDFVTSGGGAVYGFMQNLKFLSGSSFKNNKARGITNGSGGAVYSLESDISFSGSASFSNNEAGLRGGAVYQEKGLIKFQSGADFILNSADGSGGAVYASAGIMNFNDSVLFASNTASGDLITSGGGAVYAFTQTLNFFSEVSFKNNKAQGLISGSGGAVYASESDLSFVQAVSFTDNEAKLRGGAAYQDKGLFDFQSDADFVLNSAGVSGGAVYASAGIMTFNDSVLFASNTASGDLITSGGGAVYAFAQTLNFLSDASFNNNKAKGITNGSGGAIYASESGLSFSESVSFMNNEAVLRGGAVYQDGGNASFDASVVFENNIAGSDGGAVYLNGKGKIEFTDVKFISNQSGGNGGAVYLKGLSASELAEIYFNQADSDVTMFNANTANGSANSLHFAGYSYAEFNVLQNQTVNVNDAVTAGGINNTLTAQGGGTFNLNDNISGYESLNLNLNEVAFNLAAGKNMSLNNLSVLNGSVLNVQNAVAKTILVGGDFTLDSQSELRLSVFSYGESDIIEVDGKAFLDGTVSVKAGVGTYDNKWFNLVNVQDGFDETDFAVKSFDNNDVHPADPRVLKYNFEFDESKKHFMLVVNGIRKSNFSSIGGLGKNQKNVSKMFDSLSANASRPLANVIDGINEMSAGAQQKQALLETAPYFTVNALNYNLYNRSKHSFFNSIEKTEKVHNAWAYMEGDSQVFGSDENSFGDFKASNYGAAFGAGTKLTEDFMLGFFGKYNTASLSQEANKGDLSIFGVGAYALANANAWQFKAALGYEGQSYDITRSVNVSAIDAVRSAKSEFNSYVLEADAETSYNIPVSGIISLNPFAGINGSWAHYGGFTETGADILSLKIDGSNVFVSNVRIGVSANAEVAKLRLGLSLEYNRILSGYMHEFNGTLNGETEVFETVGSEPGKDIAGLNLTADYAIASDVKLFAGGVFKTGENYSNLYGNIGVRYSFK
ncbi:MAG: hypothetical protein FWF00_03490 [Endomicrobia bacterium]|nr:hypothetical protein [Endomicrobiia bacterium]MCL2506741.1 hypothetical protein [Endomicrobiia bacterium]